VIRLERSRTGQPTSARLFWPGPVPGPAVHRDPTSHRAGHSRPRSLRRDHRPAPWPDRQRGAGTGLTRAGTADGTRHDPAHRPGDQAHHSRAHRPAHATTAHHPLGRLDPPPGTRPLVPPARLCPGRLLDPRRPAPTGRARGSGEASSRSGAWPGRSRLWAASRSSKQCDLPPMGEPNAKSGLDPPTAGGKRLAINR
jgi:hypothetical protein